MTSFFDLFQLVASNVWLYGGTLLLVLSVLVFVHEFGHYFVARLCGVRVETFSIGFGKELFGRTDSHGTRWKFSLIPLGGYVKMFGDTDPASAGHADGVQDGEEVRPYTKAEKDEAFFSKSVGKRAAIVFAGPAINFIFAIILLAGLYGFYGQPVTAPMASGIMVGSAADKAGFQPHDRIVEIDGQAVNRFEDIRRAVMVGLDVPMEFVIERGDKTLTINATPEKVVITDHFGFEHSKGMLGIIGPGRGILLESIVAVNGREAKTDDQRRSRISRSFGREMTISLERNEEQTDQIRIHPRKDYNEDWGSEEAINFNVLMIDGQMGGEFVKHGLVGGFVESVRETAGITMNTLKALGQMFTGMRSATELGGIIRIGAIAGDMAQSGIIALITFTALLSINLGLINLFPIPMLDGGHLVFYAVEAVKGSPIPEQMQEYAFRFGLAVLVCIMVFANLNDLIQLFL